MTEKREAKNIQRPEKNLFVDSKKGPSI